MKMIKLNPKETQFLEDYRALTTQGKTYVLKTMELAKDFYRENLIIFPSWNCHDSRRKRTDKFN